MSAEDSDLLTLMSLVLRTLVTVVVGMPYFSPKPIPEQENAIVVTGCE